MRRRAALLLALCGCSSALPVHANDWHAVTAAAGILGIDVEPSRRRWGAVTVTVRDAGLGAVGKTLDDEGCSREVWATDEPIALAHELGHALGLDHVDDPANLMHRFVGRDTTDLTDGQRETIASEVDKIARCR